MEQLPSVIFFFQAIDFAKEQADEDLWEDLLKYSETKPREHRPGDSLITRAGS